MGFLRLLFGSNIAGAVHPASSFLSMVEIILKKDKDKMSQKNETEEEK